MDGIDRDDPNIFLRIFRVAKIFASTQKLAMNEGPSGAAIRMPWRVPAVDFRLRISLLIYVLPIKPRKRDRRLKGKEGKQRKKAKKQKAKAKSKKKQKAKSKKQKAQSKKAKSKK